MRAVEEFAAKNNTKEIQFLLGRRQCRHRGRDQHRGQEGLTQMLFLVYGAVMLLCFITFRSWRAVHGARCCR